MGFIELALIALGLSMDAFAVSICKGLGMRELNYRQALLVALFFGGFQGLMPLIGWVLGVQFQQYIVSFDHWIAFLLLAFIGGKMVFDALRNDLDSSENACGPDFVTSSLDIKQLLLLAIATSIDALAIGITFAFLEVDIISAVICIGAITFCLAFIGVLVGNKFGAKYEKPATILGGIVLILIGLKILLEHLGIIHF